MNHMPNENCWTSTQFSLFQFSIRLKENWYIYFFMCLIHDIRGFCKGVMKKKENQSINKNNREKNY